MSCVLNAVQVSMLLRTTRHSNETCLVPHDRESRFHVYSASVRMIRIRYAAALQTQRNLCYVRLKLEWSSSPGKKRINHNCKVTVLLTLQNGMLCSLFNCSRWKPLQVYSRRACARLVIFVSYSAARFLTTRHGNETCLVSHVRESQFHAW